MFKLLEGFKRSKLRVTILQPANKTNGDLVIVQVIDKTAAIDAVFQRPTNRVLDQAGLCLAWRQPP